MITIYGSGSPNVRKPIILMEELGLAYDKKYVAVLNGAQFTPEFLALNPLGRVPVIVDDAMPDMPIFESGAILIYLAETYPGGDAFLPKSGPDRYAVHKWLMLQMGNIGPMFGQLNHFIITPDERDGYAHNRYREQSHRLYRLLDNELAKRPWLAGDFYSLADIATYPWVLYAARHSVDMATHPHLADWIARVEARPAVQRAAESILTFQLDDKNAAASATQETFDKFFWREKPGAGLGVDLSPMRVV